MEFNVKMLLGRINTLKQIIASARDYKKTPVFISEYLPCDYKSGKSLPKSENFLPFDGFWGGKPDAHAWFRFTVDVEKIDGFYSAIEISDLKEFVNRWDADNPQFMPYVDGELAQGIDVNHRFFKIESGKKEVYVYAYNGAKITEPLKFFANVIYRSKITEYFYEQSENILYYINLFPEYSEYASLAVNALNEAYKLIDFLNPRSESFYKSVKVASDYLKKEFYEKYADKNATEVSVIGHTHIDLAWLWSFKQTREKAQRSFATVIALMDEFPDYKFMSSQTPLYKAVKEEDPALYAKIKERVKEGRWEVEGAMELEADCNIPSGESFIRQIKTGKKFFKDEFNVDSKILWLPDVFGYSGSLPQILKKCGVETFVTSKISWNDVNTAPYDIFNWYGLDDSHVFGYFITAQGTSFNKEPAKITTYVGTMTPAFLQGTVNRIQQKELSKRGIITMGFGDGGGGTTREMAMRTSILKDGLPGTPKAVYKTATEHTAALKKDVDGKKLPYYKGELYFERHRGTLTSAMRNKKNNRRAEFTLTAIEFLTPLFSALGLPEENHDKYLEKSWDKVLLNQFHDIIPGSSIPEVYEVTDKEYAEILNEGGEILTDAFARVAEKFGGKNVCFNLSGFTQSGYVTVDGNYRYVENVPAKGFKTVELTPLNDSVKVSEKTIENDFIKVIFNDRFEIENVYDKRADRYILSAPAAICAYEDYPDNCDCWEISRYYREKRYDLTLSSVKDVDIGAKKGKIITYTLGKTVIETTVLLGENDEIITFNGKTDMQTDHVLIRAEFPLDINANKATCEVQFGNLERPTTRNNSIEYAQFEVCAHKYADISDGGYGVSLINDSKYGHSVLDNVLSVSLVKYGTYPGETNDSGIHTYTFELYPHLGDFKSAKTTEKAYLLNQPLVLCEGGNAAGAKTKEFSFIKSSSNGVVIEAIKQADDKSGCIVRLYENLNRRETVTLTTFAPFKSAYVCDMLENELTKVNVTGNDINLTLKPFEIITLKLK